MQGFRNLPRMSFSSLSSFCYTLISCHPYPTTLGRDPSHQPQPLWSRLRDGDLLVASTRRFRDGTEVPYSDSVLVSASCRSQDQLCVRRYDVPSTWAQWTADARCFALEALCSGSIHFYVHFTHVDTRN